MAESREFLDCLGQRLAVAGLTLDPAVGGALERYYDLLAKWNSTINLTALRLDGYPSETLDRLLVEPLIAAEHVPVDRADVWLDLGTGGGSPAIPLKVARSVNFLTMVESNSRKVAFLREAVRALGLSDASVLTERIEALPTRFAAESVGLVTIRAVKLNAEVLPMIDQLLARGGRLMRFGDVAALPGPFRTLLSRSLPGAGGFLTISEKS
jgi:16S rRNA (guanine527-N7)-methyltransferase